MAGSEGGLEPAVFLRIWLLSRRRAPEEAEEAKRPPPSRQTEASLGDDMGDGLVGAITVSAGIGVTDLGDDGRDVETASGAT